MSYMIYKALDSVWKAYALLGQSLMEKHTALTTEEVRFIQNEFLWTINYISAILGPRHDEEGVSHPDVALNMSQYQADNLLSFLCAVYDQPYSIMRGWDTGDWYGELTFMLEAQMADKLKANRPSTRIEEHTHHPDYYHGATCALCQKQVCPKCGTWAVNTHGSYFYCLPCAKEKRV